MTPGELKVIAEGMGYRAWVCVNEVYKGQVRFEQIIAPRGHKEYNPLTNAEQCMEIMEKLEISIKQNFVHEEAPSSIFANVLHCEPIQGKTINEAVCNAAFEYLK